MINKQDKQAILNGAYGITRDGNKCKYVGLSTDDKYPFVFVKYNSSDRIIDVKNLGEDLVYYSGETHSIDVVGLWEDKPDPFNLEKALNGEPVMLRNDKKAYIKYIMPSEYKGKYPLRGYIFDPTFLNDVETDSWTLDGLNTLDPTPHIHDIIGMWKEPEPVSENVTVTLPRALRQPRDEMWFINKSGIFPSNYDKNIPEYTFHSRPYFGSEQDAKAWWEAMMNSRGI